LSGKALPKEKSQLTQTEDTSFINI